MEKINKRIIKDSVPVTNNPKILSWIVEEQIRSYDDNKKALSSDLRESLTKVFGKQSTTKLFFNPNSSKKYKVWIFKYKNLEFNIFSASGKGTTYEICGASYNDIRTGKYEKEIIDFLTEINKVL